MPLVHAKPDTLNDINDQFQKKNWTFHFNTIASSLLINGRQVQRN